MHTPATPPPWADIPPTGPILRLRNACEYVGLPKASFYRAQEAGRLPQPIKLSEQISGWPRPWLDAALAAMAQQSAPAAPNGGAQ